MDGNIVDSSDPTRKVKTTSFEDRLLTFLSGDSSDEKSKKTAVTMTANEDVVRERLLNYAENKPLAILLEEAGIHNADEDTVEILFDIGVDLMISIYCTRGWNFGAEKFKDAMEKMQLKPIIAHKLYRTLEQWRNLCKPPPAMADTPSISSSSVSVAAPSPSNASALCFT